ncbi:hypothetical protein HORIV_01890 [Vreelandella olivaria]|uniref:Uncharacterized protein n=1 Tax=Vreelandella olivaria TaxID=390919 RepID=A0ABM7GBP0_9GAMM|nr:hypothetical protein HORIV_01890 [Halomonas olivaria]
MLGLLPLWLWMLWPLFATLVYHSLAWLWRYPLLAALCGAISGPLLLRWCAPGRGDPSGLVTPRPGARVGNALCGH